MSHEVAKSVAGRWTVVPSNEREAKGRIYFDRLEAERRAAELNRERKAEELTTMGFGWTEDEQ